MHALANKWLKMKSARMAVHKFILDFAFARLISIRRLELSAKFIEAWARSYFTTKLPTSGFTKLDLSVIDIKCTTGRRILESAFDRLISYFCGPGVSLFLMNLQLRVDVRQSPSFFAQGRMQRVKQVSENLVWGLVLVLEVWLKASSGLQIPGPRHSLMSCLLRSFFAIFPLTKSCSFLMQQWLEWRWSAKSQEPGPGTLTFYALQNSFLPTISSALLWSAASFLGAILRAERTLVFWLPYLDFTDDLAGRLWCRQKFLRFHYSISCQEYYSSSSLFRLYKLFINIIIAARTQRGCFPTVDQPSKAKLQVLWACKSLQDQLGRRLVISVLL